MSLVPTGLDYLAAPVWILEALNRRTSAAETSFISLGNSAFWNDPLACFRKCRCKQGVCPVNVNKLYMGTTKIRKPAPVIPPEAVWKQHSLGAVLFGDARSRLSKDADIDRPEYLMPTRLRRARQQISGSGGDGIASSSSATSFNDSGVYLDPESSSDSGADRKRQCVVLPDARMYSESDAGKGSVRAYVAG
ncbi:hypothetical protein B0A55_13638 [Friedmanniomyces simplex]|nr:hypothetical protein B0A55_13638 [Friedmanniomyces simplex]